MTLVPGRFRNLLAGLVIAGVAGVGAMIVALASPQTAPDLTVHEWGTFTTVGGENGQPQMWRSLAGPSDLPCFVATMPNGGVKIISTDASGAPTTQAMTALVRMETPVLYFYSPRAVTVDVGVQFPRGAITEWYPKATVKPAFAPFELNNTVGTINWNTVQVKPASTESFPTEPGKKSHYYAARETDAAPISVYGQPEKFLFYRGIANFQVPIAVRQQADGRIAIENTSSDDLPKMILFENRGGKIGYRKVDASRGQVIVDRPVLGAEFEPLAWDLEIMLKEQGLFAREAKAMVATWRDSWFEEGTRVFYLLPQAAVDRVLPLNIYPRPAKVARAFVGRFEVISDTVEQDVAAALDKNDLPSLNKYGRFLESITSRLVAKGTANVTRVQSALRHVLASQVVESPCR